MPSGLAGVDIEQLLDEAESVSDLLADDDEANPALRLGAAMAGTAPLRDKLVLVDDRPRMTGFADWAEQLIAESTGKNGTGVLPVVVQGGSAENADPEVAAPPPDVTVARLVTDVAGDDDADNTDVTSPTAADPSRSEVKVSGSLGAQLLLWEVATATACRILGVNPFDQPDVESAKKATHGLLEANRRQARPARFHRWRHRGARPRWRLARRGHTIAAALNSLFSQLDPQHGYVAVMAYLDRLADASLADARRVIATTHTKACDLRLGAPLPALDRAVSQGRSAHWRLPSDHLGAVRGPAPFPAGASPSGTSSRLRPAETHRSWQTTVGPSCDCI